MSSPPFNPDLIPVLKDLLKIGNQLLGTNAANWEELLNAILPPQTNTIRRLCVVYEREMIACSDAKAYFAACVMGAAMLEALLLLLCMVNENTVKLTKRYLKRSGKRVENFETTIYSFGLEDLVEISAELGWIPPSLIDDEWKKMLPEAYLELAATRYPNTSKRDRQASANSLVANPAYSLMFILNMMRNRMHSGRWLRERHQLENEAAFSGWAQVALVAAAHIRDCLISQHSKSIMENWGQLVRKRLGLTHGG